MRLVVDANIVLSGLLRDGATRELLLHGPLELYAPAWLWEEVRRHASPLAKRARVPTPVARAVLERLLDRIQPVPEAALAPHARAALGRCGRSGAKDAPYIACCLAVDGALWPQDRQLAGEAGARVVTTAELAKRFA